MENDGDMKTKEVMKEGGVKEQLENKEQPPALTNMEDELKRLHEMLESEKKRSEDVLTKLKYLQADFENYRKRIDREIQEIEEFSMAKLVQKLLPVLDELELAINTAEGQGIKGALLDGVKMVYKNLNSILESEGLRSIESIGKPFNPKFHEAIEKIQGRHRGEDIVIEEIRRGYTFRGQVLRPSLVKVEVASKEGNLGEEVRP